jgi:hypothetical protein
MSISALSSFWLTGLRDGFLGLAGAGIGALAPGRLLYRFFFSA